MQHNTLQCNTIDNTHTIPKKGATVWLDEYNADPVFAMCNAGAQGGFKKGSISWQPSTLLSPEILMNIAVQHFSICPTNVQYKYPPPLKKIPGKITLGLHFGLSKMVFGAILFTQNI